MPTLDELRERARQRAVADETNISARRSAFWLPGPSPVNSEIWTRGREKVEVVTIARQRTIVITSQFRDRALCEIVCAAARDLGGRPPTVSKEEAKLIVKQNRKMFGWLSGLAGVVLIAFGFAFFMAGFPAAVAASLMAAFSFVLITVIIQTIYIVGVVRRRVLQTRNGSDDAQSNDRHPRR
ncbi:MAG TPA: hypothetical protein VGI81_04300 [Tepidisphaeraceae bacterium]|jgi:hypothetical protein